MPEQKIIFDPDIPLDYRHRMIAFIVDENYNLVLGLRCDTCCSTTRLKLKPGVIYNQIALQDKFEELKQAHIRARLNED